MARRHEGLWKWGGVEHCIGGSEGVRQHAKTTFQLCRRALDHRHVHSNARREREAPAVAQLAQVHKNFSTVHKRLHGASHAGAGA